MSGNACKRAGKSGAVLFREDPVQVTVRVTTKEFSMKKALVAAACFALCTPAVFAQAKNFEGFSLGANYESTNTTLSDAIGSDSGSGSGLGIQAKYTFALANAFTLGLGATYSTGNHQAAIAASPTGLLSNIYTNNNFSLDVEPGYAFSNSTLGYAKVSAIGATLFSDSGSFSQTISGIGYGLGVRALVDKNMFVQMGYDYNVYQDIAPAAAAGNSLTTRGSVFSIGAGYKF